MNAFNEGTHTFQRIKDGRRHHERYIRIVALATNARNALSVVVQTDGHRAVLRGSATLSTGRSRATSVCGLAVRGSVGSALPQGPYRRRDAPRADAVLAATSGVDAAGGAASVG